MANDKELITKEQATDVLKFAQGLYNLNNTGIWNPYSQNANLLSLQGTPLETDFDKISSALKDTLNEAKTLQSYSQFMYYFDSIYNKTIEYYLSLMAFDLNWSCEVKDPKEYASDEFKQDVRRVNKFLKNFNYKKEFKTATWLALKNGVAYEWFRDSYGTFNDTPIEDDELNIRKNQKYTLQVLPQNKCKLTGAWNNGYLFDFDFSYFLDPTTDISLYDPCFIRKFKEVYKNPKWKYNPSAQLDERNGTYNTWAQLSPQDGMVCIKYNTSDFNTIPPFSPLMKIVSQNDLIHKYQMDKDAASAWAVLYGSIQTYDNAQGGVKPNQFKIDPADIGTFLNLVQSSLKSIMKTVALPLDDTHFGQFVDQNVNMESTGIENSASQGAYASSMIYSTGKKNQAEVTNGLLLDFYRVEPLYRQFEDILNYYVNRKTKKYKFTFGLKGTNLDFERDARIKRVTDFANLGLVLNESYWASAIGIEPYRFTAMLQEAKYGGMSDDLMMLMNRNTMNSGIQNGNGGNPVKPESQLSDSGSNSRDYQ